MRHRHNKASHAIIIVPCVSHHDHYHYYYHYCLQEEQAKRAARAIKFGLPEERQAPLQYAPDPEDVKRAARARKFGADYQPPTADTLLEKAGRMRAAAAAHWQEGRQEGSQAVRQAWCCIATATLQHAGQYASLQQHMLGCSPADLCWSRTVTEQCRAAAVWFVPREGQIALGPPCAY